MPDDEPQINPARIRAGMLMIVAVSIIALVLAIVIDEPTARIIFVGVFAIGLVQVWRIRRANLKSG